MNTTPIQAFIDKGKDCRSRNISYINGELFSYSWRMAWRKRGRIITPRDICRSRTTTHHMNLLFDLLRKAGYRPSFTEKYCTWGRSGESYSFEGGTVTLKKFLNAKWNYVEIRGKHYITSRKLVPIFHEKGKLLKKVRALVKQRATAIDTENRYRKIRESELYKTLFDLPEGTYGSISVGFDMSQAYGTKLVYLGNRSLDPKWLSGINKTTVREAEEFLQAIDDRTKVLIALQHARSID